MIEWTAEPCTTDLYYLGESCRWDEVRAELSWVDLDAGRFFRASADHRRVEVIRRYDVGGYLTAVAPMIQRGDGWMVARDQSIGRLSEAGEFVELARPESAHAATVRMNDGAADPWGRFWIGSMAFDAALGAGSLYRYHRSSGVQRVVADVTIANGLAWSADRRTMYFVDSGPGTIDAFDVDDNGEVSARRRLVQFDPAIEGAPDGLCVDAEGALWVAVWGGFEVRRYSPRGELLARVRVPTPQPASCAIGGANATTLYVTTAREDLSAAVLDADPDAGRLFCCDVGVPGLPIDPYRDDVGAPVERGD